jgi:hypothetical protein
MLVEYINGVNITPKTGKETIIELDSHPDGPLFDHTFTSPIYRDQLLNRIGKYIDTNCREI